MSSLPRTITAPLVGALLTAAVVHGQSSPVTYVYDELGRLVSVINTTGDAAIYAYDAVGNLLSIARQTAGTVSIIEFTPNAGPVGTSVTIYGTGFSTTPSQNTLTFNGVTGTVLTATATKLTTTVPSGATTGPLAVTTPSGSATSGTSFTVASLNLPTVTGFTPTIGTAGTAVSVTGTNFDAVLANNRAKFNLTAASLLAGSTTTTLLTTVPGATASGRIKVDTPLGTAISASDFFIPPSPYTPSDVQYTGRMNYGDSQGVAITTSGKIGLVVFDGALGQRTSIKAVPGPNSSVSLYKPDGSVLTSRPTGILTVLLEPGTLPVTGTYTIGVDPVGTGTGTLTLTLYNVPADVTGTFTPSTSGDQKTVTIGTPGQNARYTFSGTTGQRISMKISNGPTGTVSMLNPDESTLTSKSITAVTQFIDTTSLVATGTHAVTVNLSEANTGSVTLTMYDVPADTTGTVTINGGTVGVTLSTPGQNGSLTFSGTSGQLVTVRVTNNTMSTTTVKLLKPDGSQLTSSTSPLGSFNLAQQTLPVTGTYTVVVDPSQWNTGSMNVAVTNP